MKKILIKNLISELEENRKFLICCASFEARCLSIPLALISKAWETIAVCENLDAIKTGTNAQKIREVYGGNTINVQLSVNSPTDAADALIDVFRSADYTGSEIVVDFSTFTHEHVLILIKCMQYCGISLSDVCWLYCRVKEYSFGLSPEEKWLSKGVSEIRSVLGYSGCIIPERPTALMVLVGFEGDRALEMIETIEPDYLWLGKGSSTASESEEMHSINQRFHSLIRNSLASFREEDLQEFEFSCNNVDQVEYMVKEFSNRFKDIANLIIVPMNTKISTLGVAKAALADLSLHVIYGQAFVYNTEGYSVPDEDCYMLNNVF